MKDTGVAAAGASGSRVAPIYLAFFVMGFVDAVGTLVGFARKEFAISGTEAGLLGLIGYRTSVGSSFAVPLASFLYLVFPALARRKASD